MATEDSEFVVIDESDVQDFNPEGVLPLSSDKLVEVRRWLAPTDFTSLSSEWGKHRNSHLSGTGNWIFDTDQYRQWHDSHRGGLWIKAIAGAGKSVIAATIISKLATEERIPVLYFFFRHIISANQTPISLVRDYLTQVLQYSPKLQHDLFKLLDSDRRSIESMSLDELWTMLVSTLTQLPRAYCVIDALDEMDAGNETFLDSLVALAQERPDSIKILMTSRPIPRVEQHIRNTDILELSLQSRLIDPDISVYVKHRMKEVAIGSELHESIHDAMCRRADGHFLYARLMMDDVLEAAKDTTSDNQRLLTTLDELPTPMAHMYSQLLLEHSRRSQTPQALQVEILQWVTRAERPLRLLELSSMVDTKQIMPHVSKDAKSIIREACGPLLEIFEDETVHPIHHSFTEYLYDKNRLDQGPEVMEFPVLDYEQVQGALAVTCIQHLASGWHTEWSAFGSESDTKLSDYGQYSNHNDKVAAKNKLKLKYPYLDYVTGYWTSHVRKSEPVDSLFTTLYEVFSKDSGILHACLDLEPDKRQFKLYYESNDIETWSLLHVAAAKGIAFLVEFLLQKGHEAGRMTSAERTPLSLAAQNGHSQVVEILLKANVPNDEPDGNGLKPLHHAARSNHWRVVKLLLKAGVDPFTPKTKEWPGRMCGNALSTVGESPAQYACQSGHLETMKVIIPFLKGEMLQKALSWALTFCRAEVAFELLKHPDIDVNYHINNATPLHLASTARMVGTMRLLLGKGAEVKLLSVDHLQDDWAQTRSVSPLHAFMRGNGIMRASPQNKMKVSTIIEGVSMLLEAGIDLNVADMYGFTVLHIIMSMHRKHLYRNQTESIDRKQIKQVLSMLFDRGLSPEPVTKDGSNALHFASGMPPEVLDLLLNNGVGLNVIRKSDGKTPLMAAISVNDVEVVEFLLDKGADVHIADAGGNSPLHCVGQLCGNVPDLNILRALIGAGADVNSRNLNGDTVLHVAKFEPALADLLLKHGFDIESKNKSGQTVLFQSISKPDSDYEKLIELGADPLTRDNQGRTILHALFQNPGNTAKSVSTMIEYFVGKGVHPLSTDAQGNTMWHMVVNPRYNYQLYQELVLINMLAEYRVSPTTRNVSGHTPLHTAFLKGPGHSKKFIEFLLDDAQLDVNVSDYDQVRPLHIAASYDLMWTWLLLQRGADCVAATREGQTPLMIACRTRQCDIVCCLLDYYQENHLLHLVDQTDEVGRTALHYACRSGRPESVAMLLEAGANTNTKDQNSEVPLHACAEYLEEDQMWGQSVASLHKTNVRVNYILLTDSSRPVAQMDSDPVRIRETIRLLVEYGADISFMAERDNANLYKSLHDTPVSSQLSGPIDPLTKAFRNGCTPVVSELLFAKDKCFQEKISDNSVSKEIQTSGGVPSKQLEVRKVPTSQLSSFDAEINLLKTQSACAITEEEVEVGENNFGLVEEVLEKDEEHSFKKMVELGACFSNLEGSDHSVLNRLASWGFADLLRYLREDARFMIMYQTKEMVIRNNDPHQGPLYNILHAAFLRGIPNMTVVKTIISTFQLDINEMLKINTFGPAKTYLHLLAAPFAHVFTEPDYYWWHTRALTHLLENGADINIPDSDGNTPLMIALKSARLHEPARVKAIEIMLHHGANPNAVNKKGLTCLNIVAAKPKFVKLLLKHGADPLCGIRSFLVDAIKAQDTDTIEYVIASGANLNRLPQPVAKSTTMPAVNHTHRRTSEPQYFCSSASHSTHDISAEDRSDHAYPIHIAASGLFNTPETVSRAHKIIKMLLDGGANPFCKYEDGSSILHCLIDGGGIFEPFLKLPECDTEVRDARGCTLLLATCGSRQMQMVGRRWTLSNGETIQTLINHGASITAVDNEGRNALHYLVNTFCKRRHYYEYEHEWEEEQTLLQSFAPSCLSRTDSDGRTPYHYAVSKCHVDVIQVLLAQGANPLIPDPLDNTTALHHVASKLTHDEDVHLVQKLYSFVSPISQSESRAELQSSTKLPKDLANFADTMDSKCLAMIRRRSTHRLFMSLLDRGLPINSPDINGETPVFKLAEAGALRGLYFDEDNVRINVSLLLSAFHLFERAGANLKARNHAGQSLLHKLAMHTVPWDAWRGKDTSGSRKIDLTESFKWLVGKGLDVAWEDSSQRTCLDVAATSGATWLTQLYERRG